MFLLHHFQEYMMKKLYHEDDGYTYIDKNLKHGMIFVQRYLRMRHVMLFRLSNDVLQVGLLCLGSVFTPLIHQFNFYDHTKLILSEGALVVSVIDQNLVLKTWSLEQLLAPMDRDITSKEKKKIEAIIHKLTYAR